MKYAPRQPAARTTPGFDLQPLMDRPLAPVTAEQATRATAFVVRACPDDHGVILDQLGLVTA